MNSWWTEYSPQDFYFLEFPETASDSILSPLDNTSAHTIPNKFIRKIKLYLRALDLKNYNLILRSEGKVLFR